MNRMGRWMLAAALLLGAAQAAFAQSGDCRFVGTVKDVTGAILPGATVTVHDERTGENRTVSSDAQGAFLVQALKPSTYTVRGELSGFQAGERRAVTLAAGQVARLDLSLLVAGQQEAITVTGELAGVDTSSARNGANVNEREVTYLPINGRQLSQLYLQAPGALNSGTGTFGDIRFSGRAVEQNVVRYDGVEGSAIIDASPGNLNGELASPFRLQSSLENVQEFRVESNMFPAEYGTGTGGQVTVVTKSGSNQMHGSLFEYIRDDGFDAPNAFDPTVDGKQQKSSLRQHQFGVSVGGPIAKDRAWFFGTYEGYRLNSGINLVEAVPSAAAAARAVPEVAPLLDAFRSPQAILLPGASANPDFDIAQLQDEARVNEDSFSGRVDFRLNDRHRLYARYFQDNGFNNQPEGVTGRRVEVTAKPRNGVLALQSNLGTSAMNELKVGYNSASTDVNGIAPTVNGIDLSAITLNITGSVANTGIAGQGSSSGVAIPGGLVRQNGATNGRGAPYRPYSLSLIDALSWTRGAHFLKVGGELRMIRMKTDRLGGTTYTFSNLNDFLANRSASVAYLGDVSAASPFNGGATGQRDARTHFLSGYIQDEWRLNPHLTANLGLRYDYYAPLQEADHLDVVFDPVNGRLLPPDTPFFKSKSTNFQPRVSFAWTPSTAGSTVFRAGFGMLTGIGQIEDQIQPIESDRISSSITGASFPVAPAVFESNFVNNPTNRSYQPRAYMPDYTVPERVYQYSGSVQQTLPYRVVATVAYVGSQGRNLFLRSITNRITEVRPDGTVIREFDIVGADGKVSKPYAEIDVKTSGGRDSYNALQVSLVRTIQKGLTLNAQYALGKSYGTSAGSNETLTAANNARALSEFDYDLGYNRFDVRHTFNLSALYALPFGKGRGLDLGGAGNALFGNWEIGAILNARSGLPIDLQITRPDVVFVDGTGAIFGSSGAGRTAVINTPGGGNSRNVRRPDLIPGVDPYIKDGTQWLNPAAFAIPAPGTFGNLERGSIRGPSFKQVDLSLNKKLGLGGHKSLDARVEVFNALNWINYRNPSGQLSNALGTGTNQIQPGQPFTQAAAGSTWGKLVSTVGTTVGLGTARQVQLAVRLNF
jgi:hypothetical protein